MGHERLKLATGFSKVSGNLGKDTVRPYNLWKEQVGVAQTAADERSSLGWRECRMAGCTIAELITSVKLEVKATRVGWNTYFRYAKDQGHLKNEVNPVAVDQAT